MQIAQLEDLLQFSPLKAVFTTSTNGSLLDAKAIVWATFELQDEQIKFFSIQHQAFTEQDALQELIQLAINFEKQSESFFTDLHYQLAQQKITIEQQLRTNTAFKQQVQPFFQILEELNRTNKELPSLLAILNYWMVLFKNSSIKKSFFRRYELLSHFKKTQQQFQSIFSVEKYQQFHDFVIDFAKENNIKDIHLLLYGLFSHLTTHNKLASTKRFFVSSWYQIFKATNPVNVLIYDAGFLKLIENQEFDKNRLFGAAINTEELLRMHSTVQQTEQVTLITDSISIQTGIFGVSQMALLAKKIKETSFDLVFLDTSSLSFTPRGKTPLLFQAFNKEDKQVFFTIQTALNQLSDTGRLCVFLDSNELLTAKKYNSLRRLIEEWASQIQILENKIENNAILILSKNSAKKGVFYTELNKNAVSSKIVFSSSLEDWQPKTKPSPFFKLLAAHSTSETKGLFTKTYSLPNSNQVKNFFGDNQKNLIFKVESTFYKYNQKQLRKHSQSKVQSETVLSSLFIEKMSMIDKTVDEQLFLKVKQKNIVEGDISLIENGVWYYEPTIFDKFYPLDSLFPNRKKGENIILLWASTNEGGQVWLFDEPIFPFFLEQLLPQAHLFPLFVFDKGKKRYNFLPAVLNTFRKIYTQSYEKRLILLEEHIQRLFNVADFEFLQLSVELSLSLQMWTSWLETPVASLLYSQFDTQKSEIEAAFEQGKRLFIETQRLFENLGMKGVRNKESHQTLKTYFQNPFFEQLTNYWGQIEQEKLENFIVPTLENMHEDAIFEYVIAVWSDESFRHKYQKELQDNLPRIPFYKDFHAYAQKGKKIKELFLKSTKTELEVIEIASDREKPTKKYWQVDQEDTSKIWFDANTLIENVPSFFSQLQINGVTLLDYILKELRKQKKSLKEGIAFLSR